MDLFPFYKQIELGPMQNFVYLIGDKRAGECAVIDPGWDAGAVLKAADAEGLRISKILITHGHPDHTNAVGALLEKTGARVCAHEKEAEFWGFPWPNLTKLRDGDFVEVGSVKIKAIHTPGHTPGSVCYHAGNALFTGDTLFIGSCGRADLPGSSPPDLFRSLRKLADLEEGTIVYPGHNYADAPSSTIGDEKRHNPYLQVPRLEDFLTFF